ncbi:MAG TPA: DUF4290 domain-containing protein [Bacteroidia bacterium]|nr:DUF4290 domain-containing protein [Bacteroidia bacterium]
MEYNSGRNPLIISEYGRNIQKMIEFACTIKDKEERNTAAQAIVAVMGSLNPHLRDITDFRHKLWDHLFIIADFKLDVDSPYPMPSAQTLKVKPKKVPYPSNKIRFKHYGKTMELMINELKKMDDGTAKNQLALTLANFMKFEYLNWNRDTVEDKVIFEHLRELSKGAIIMDENTKLQETFELTTKNAGLSKTQKRIVHKRKKGGRK